MVTDNLFPSRLASEMVDALSFATLTLSTDEKPGRERHNRSGQLFDSRNNIIPAISTPLFVVSMATGSIPSGVTSEGRHGMRSRQKMP